jgi:drug/metabolite transporter (DMT)-like permease
MKKQNTKLLPVFICISIATIGFSLNGPFGRILDLPSEVIAWARGFFAAISLLLLFIWKKQKIFVFQSRKDILYLILSGVFISGNWLFFYMSIKASTVAVAVVSLYTYPFITSIIEPFIFEERHNVYDCIGAVFVVIGVFLIVPRFTLNNTITQGILFGILSGLSFSLRNIFSRKLTRRYSSTLISFYNFIVVGIVFFPFLFFNDKPFTVGNVVILMVFGAIITTLSIVLFTYSLKSITSSLASIFLATQPVVTIVLNYFINGDVPSLKTVCGGSIISVTVLAVALVHNYAGEG